MQVKIVNKNSDRTIQIQNLLTCQWYKDKEGDLWFVLDNERGICEVLVYSEDDGVSQCHFKHDDTSYRNLSPVDVNITLEVTH